jgi:colicin import membrane protein
VSSDSIYAKPVAPRIIIRPALASVALHTLLVAFLLFNWADMSEPKTIEAKVIPPQVINARLVDVSEIRAKPRPKPKAQPKPKVKAAKKVPTKPKVVPKLAPKPVVKKPAPVAKPRVEPKPEPRITEAELAAIARADLARAVEEESQQMEATATAEEMALSYAALIQQTVVNYWSRPPSARNGMEALLQIQLIPTGEVVSVSVLKSSGNTAFDRSAINAVEKAGSFPELKNLPTREFEKTFRRFRLLFRPEDLRY